MTDTSINPTPPNPEPGSTRPDELRHEIHMKMLSKSDSAKNLRELTVVPLGFAVSIAVELLADHEQRIRRSIAAGLPQGYTFKQVDWGDGIIREENVEDETKSLAYCKGFNDAVAACRAAVLGEEA